MKGGMLIQWFAAYARILPTTSALVQDCRPQHTHTHTHMLMMLSDSSISGKLARPPISTDPTDCQPVHKKDRFAS